MIYMKRAGYDLSGAVTLQQTFVRLSEASGRNQNWLEGLFASHPPSQETRRKKIRRHWQSWVQAVTWVLSAIPPRRPSCAR